MTTKNKIIKTLDSQPADIEASTDGQKGGEGYVIDKDVKLVNRAAIHSGKHEAREIIF